MEGDSVVDVCLDCVRLCGRENVDEESSIADLPSRRGMDYGSL